jgi:ketosteroid isomerase-like protein
VRRRVEALFAAVSRGDAEPVLASFASRFEHRFLGEDHALGGSRTSLAATRAWYERLYRLLPDISFVLERIAVSGPPWDTVVVIDWQEQNSGTDGVLTTNRGVHVVHMAWGKVNRLVICPHTAGLRDTLDRLHAAGNPDAHAAPIVG